MEAEGEKNPPFGLEQVWARDVSDTSSREAQGTALGEGAPLLLCLNRSFENLVEGCH